MQDPSRAQRIAIALLLSFTLLPQVGCVALNIPSMRHHDAHDSGGLFGSWQRTSAADPADFTSSDCTAIAAGTPESWAIDGGPLAVDPRDPTFEDPAKKQDEIPWPRFHPVPTRPVFGGR